MKKLLTASLLAATIVASASAGDKLFEFGGGYINDSLTGGANVSNYLAKTIYSYDTNDEIDSGRAYFYAELEVDFPIVPNFRIEYSNPSYKSGNVPMVLNDRATGYVQNVNGFYDIDFKEYDMFLYYDFFSVFDNKNVSFDLGIGGKYLDSFVAIYDKSNSRDIYNNNSSDFVPLVYVNPSISTGGFVFDFTYEFIDFEGDKIAEYTIGAKYFFETSIGDIGVEVGYYNNSLESSSDSNLFDGMELDIKRDGYFAGMAYKW